MSFNLNYLSDFANITTKGWVRGASYMNAFLRPYAYSIADVFRALSAVKDVL